MALTQGQVSQLYVAIFNRASEGEGNAYWKSQPDMASAATAMLDTDAAKNYFGGSLDTNQAFIEHIYINTLNKTYVDDPVGISYWVNQLNGGKTRGEVVAELVGVIKDYAPGGLYYDSTDQLAINAYQQFTNRVAVCDYMADSVWDTPEDWQTSTAFDKNLPVTYDMSTVLSARSKVEYLATGGTEDTSPPSLEGTTPADDANDVAVDSDLVLTFSEDVQAGTGNFSIWEMGAAAPKETINASDAVFVGSTVILDPDADLDAGTDYYVKIAPAAVQDLAGNKFVGITTPTAFNFTTAEPDPEQRYIEETTVNDTSGYDTSYSNIIDDLLTLPDAQAGMLEPNQVQQAYLHIDPGEDFEFDHDTFVLKGIEAGAKYRIKITPDDASNFQSNKISWLYDPSGEREDLIMNFTDGFYDGVLYSDTFTAQEDGDHFLSVSMRWSADYGEYADGPEPYDIELIGVPSASVYEIILPG